MVFVRNHQLADKVSDAPEEEQDTGGTHQRAHIVHHLRHSRHIRSELREQIRHQHEERCSGRVTDFQLVSGSNKLRAIPETGSRLYGQAIDGCRNDESKPTHQVVYGSVLFHCQYDYRSLFVKNKLCGAKIAI